MSTIEHLGSYPCRRDRASDEPANHHTSSTYPICAQQALRPQRPYKQHEFFPQHGAASCRNGTPTRECAQWSRASAAEWAAGAPLALRLAHAGTLRRLPAPQSRVKIAIKQGKNKQPIRIAWCYASLSLLTARKHHAKMAVLHMCKKACIPWGTCLAGRHAAQN